MIKHALALFAILAAPAAAQSDSATTLHGVVRTDERAAVEAANVFLLETLEGALSDADGKFALRTSRRGPVTIVVRRIGYRSAQLQISLPRTEPLDVAASTEPSLASTR